jgi:hypothetical protein
MINFTPPVGINGVELRYGKFNFYELSGGNVQIDGNWPSDNLVILRNVCGTGHSIQLHHLLTGHFQESFQAALDAAPGYLARMLGGFCARHKMHSPSRSLSIHSWGAAFDINWDCNLVATPLVSDLPQAFINALKYHGWEWGGDWHTDKDAMHFQYATGV